MMDRDGSKMIGGWLGKLADSEAIRLGRKLKMREGYGKKINFEYMWGLVFLIYLPLEIGKIGRRIKKCILLHANLYRDTG